MDINELSDRMEIMDVLSRYVIAMNENDRETVLGCFGPDPTIDYGVRQSDGEHRVARGDEAVRRALTEGSTVWGNRPAPVPNQFARNGLSTLLQPNSTITINGKEAHAATVGVVFHCGTINDQEHIRVMGLRYEDDLQKHEGIGWRIQNRIYRNEWQFTTPGSMLADLAVKFAGSGQP